MEIRINLKSAKQAARILSEDVRRMTKKEYAKVIVMLNSAVKSGLGLAAGYEAAKRWLLGTPEVIISGTDTQKKATGDGSKESDVSVSDVKAIMKYAPEHVQGHHDKPTKQDPALYRSYRHRVTSRRSWWNRMKYTDGSKVYTASQIETLCKQYTDAYNKMYGTSFVYTY